MADEWQPRGIDLGLVDQRRFVFACGAGIDATVVERVDAHPKLKSRAGPWYYSWAGISAFYRSYLVNPVRMRTTVDGAKPVEGVTSIVQNSDPFTYFSNKPIYVCEGIGIDDGTLSLTVLQRAAQRDMPVLIPRLFSQAKPASTHRQARHFDDLQAATVESISTDKDGATRPFPLQVDGDYIGDRAAIELGVEPGGLTILA